MTDPKDQDGLPNDHVQSAPQSTGPAASGPGASSSGETPSATPPARPLTPEEQMALYEKDLKENDWGHQPC